MALRFLAGLLLPLMLVTGGCVTPPTSYENWRDFHAAVSAMDAQARAETYARVRSRYDAAPSDMSRLQLAYLMTIADWPGLSVDDRRAQAGRLLDAVDDGHELVPVRDTLRYVLQLQQHLDAARREQDEMGRQCAAATERLRELGSKQKALQEEIATCSEQLKALKEIENMMSAADKALDVRP